MFAELRHHPLAHGALRQLGPKRNLGAIIRIKSTAGFACYREGSRYRWQFRGKKHVIPSLISSLRCLHFGRLFHDHLENNGTLGSGEGVGSMGLAFSDTFDNAAGGKVDFFTLRTLDGLLHIPGRAPSVRLAVDLVAGQGFGVDEGKRGAAD